MKRILATVVVTLGVLTSIACASVEAHQVAKDGSFQVTFKNGMEISYNAE